jgi:formylglycine-generating enzyme
MFTYKTPVIWKFWVVTAVIFLSCKQTKVETALPAIGAMVTIPAGTFDMGGDNDQAEKNEFPKHKVQIDAFMMDVTEVTNAQFKAFVDETGYITVAERPLDWEEMKKQLPPGTPKPDDSLMQPGALVFRPTDQPVPLNNPELWWSWTIGANWKHPHGPESSVDMIMNHPVVHVAWEDADAYCKWAGKRLPTEAEWEWAARGGKKDNIYPWGNDLSPDEKPQANFFQGFFPYQNEAKDGFTGSAPVMSFPPNGYGLYDISGNVWEWCQDWFDAEYYENSTGKQENPTGPNHAFNPQMPFQQERVIRGGSFLCSEEYCSGYRNARRMGSTPDTGLNHTGFRCVKDLYSK